MAVNTYPEPYRSAPKDSMVDPSTCYNRECVSYTAWKINEATGAWIRRTGDMNGYNWVYRLPDNGYHEVSSPANGGKYVGVAKTGNHVVWWEGGNSVSEYNWGVDGGYNERNVDMNKFRWFQVVSPSNTPVEPPPAPPAPEPNVPQVVPNNPSPNTTISVGDSVIAWGSGTADSYGGGAVTREFPETIMKVIGINNGRYALNQYNSGDVGNVASATGWWTQDKVRRL